MYRQLALVMIVTSTVAVRLSAQAISPSRVAAGSAVRVTEPCGTGTPVIILDTREIPGSGTTPSWVFNIPADVALKNYPATFKCGADPVKDLGALEVTTAATRAQESAQQAAEPRVVGVANVTTGDSGETPSARLRNVMTLRVRNYKAWRDRNPQAKVVLFLAGTPLKNVVATPTATSESDPPEVFGLRLTPEVSDIDDDTRKKWVQVLQAAKRFDPIPISIGPEDQAPFLSAARIRLDVYPTYRTYGTLALYLFLAFWIVRLSRHSWMLRDMNGHATNPPYSLAKTQMVIWFIVVVGAYLYIWATTGLFSWVSTTALALIGISGATGLIAVTMDASKRADAAVARATLQAERDALNETLNNAATGLQTQLRAVAAGSPQALELSAAIAPKLARLNDLNAALAAPALSPAHSEAWIKDLVSDANGVSVHRVQMAVWTVVLVLVFVVAVRDNVLMPVFDATLLGLMGISSGTYLGFKVPEKVS